LSNKADTVFKDNYSEGGSAADCLQAIPELLASRFNTESPRAYVRTFGCQSNVADSEIIQGFLELSGFALTQSPEDAHLIIFNTCAIREHAQDRVFGNVGAVKKYKTKQPSPFIALCGCMMQQDYVVKKIRKNYPFVDLIFGPNAISELPFLLYRLLKGEKRLISTPPEKSIIEEGLPLKRDSNFKAFLPVMYGCDNFCSYCVVPLVRGRERSREPQAVIKEAEALVKAGYKDITLIGQNVNSYGKNMHFDYTFAKLLESINAVPGDFLIRFMTSHPKDCGKDLLDTMARCEKVTKHLHLPFQSGSDSVLKAMNRGYTRQNYLSLIEYAKKVMPELSVTGDVIVGFPGETEDDFEETLDLIEQVRFTSLYTFIFSPRKGTVAYRLEDNTPREDKVKRFQRLINLQEGIAAERAQTMIGCEYRVLCENRIEAEGLKIEGRTQGNVIIEFEAEPSVIGTFQNVRVTEAKNWLLKGEMLKDK
jgi:tRNA-2-methylthio-N6-dimethylallyladenosine synthase